MKTDVFSEDTTVRLPRTSDDAGPLLRTKGSFILSKVLGIGLYLKCLKG